MFYVFFPMYFSLHNSSSRLPAAARTPTRTMKHFLRASTVAKRFSRLFPESTPVVKRRPPRVFALTLPAEPRPEVRFRSRRRLDFTDEPPRKTKYQHLIEIVRSFCPPRQINAEFLGASDSNIHEIHAQQFFHVKRPLSPLPDYISISHLSPPPYHNVDELDGEGIRAVTDPLQINYNYLPESEVSPTRYLPPPPRPPSPVIETEWTPKSPCVELSPPSSTVTTRASEWGNAPRRPLVSTGWSVSASSQIYPALLVEEPEIDLEEAPEVYPGLLVEEPEIDLEEAPEISNVEWARMFGKR